MARYKKRADGRYGTKIRTGRYHDDGTPILVTLYAKSSKELEELVREKKYELEHGLYCFGADTDFETYATEWVKVKKANLSLSSKSNYQTLLKNDINLIADMAIGKITQLDIQRQINAHADKPRTCRLLVQMIDQVFKSAVQDGLIVRNPCYEIVLPEYRAKQKRALTDAEKKALKSAPFTDEERAYIMLLYGCGLRPAEAYALTWVDIDFNESMLTINKALTFDGQLPIVKAPKTDSGTREIPIPSITLSALKEFRASQPVNLKRIVFAKGGDYKSASQYEDMFDRIREKMYYAMGKKTSLCAYVFRHNYATELYYSDVSEKECARLMGHSDIRMIMDIYAHLDAKREMTAEKIKNIAF